MEVDGLTVRKVVVAIEVLLTGGVGEEEGNSVLGFLIKLQKEQDLMKGYVHAPFRDVIDRLHDNNTTKNTNSNDAREKDAKTTLSISRRQIFQLAPPFFFSKSPSFQNPTNRLSRTDCGLLWTFLQLPSTSTSPNNTKNHNNNNHTTKNHNHHTTNSSDDDNNKNDKNDAVKIQIMPS